LLGVTKNLITKQHLYLLLLILTTLALGIITVFNLNLGLVIIVVISFVFLDKLVDKNKLVNIQLIYLLFYIAIVGNIALFHLLPDSVLKLTIYSKDYLYIFFLAVGLYRLVLKYPKYINWLDLVFILYMIVNVTYLSVNHIPMRIKLMELRPIVYMFSAYLAGRILFNPASSKVAKTLRLFLYSLAVTCIFSIMIGYLVGNEKFFFHLWPYVKAYNSIFGADKLKGYRKFVLVTAGIPFVRLRDLNASFLSLGNSLFIGCITIFAFVTLKIKLTKWDRLLFYFLLFTLLISTSRAAAIAGILSILLIIFVSQKFQRKSSNIIIIGGIALIAIFLMYERLYSVYTEIARWDISKAHVGGWYKFCISLISYPFGHGFGYAGETINRFQHLPPDMGMSGEMMQGTVMAETGYIGLILFSGIFLIAAYYGYRIFKREGRNIWNSLGLAVFALNFGYYLIGLTKFDTFKFENTFVLFLLNGIVSRYYSTYYLRDLQRYGR